MLCKHSLTRWLLLITVGLQCACAQRTEPPRVAPAATEPTLLEYRFGPDDVVEIHVWKEPDLSRAVTVRPDGKISLPLIGDVQAGGVTAEELAGAITQKLRVYFQASPEVSVIVQQINSSVFYVLGEVRNQGRLAARDGTTLLQAIALAGGFTEFASKGRLIVRRKASDEAEGDVITFQFRFRDIISGREEDIVLKPGDTVFVP